MESTDDVWDGVFRELELLRNAWPAPLWTWDGRFGCAVSSVAANQEALARASIAGALPSSWTSATISAAPTHLRNLAQSCGGLRSGQMLFLGATRGDHGALGLWWPWGDAKTFSLRIGLHHAGSPGHCQARLRALFGVK